MTETSIPIKSSKVADRSHTFNSLQNWVGVLPFLLFILIFLIIPSTNLFIGAFQDPKGNFTFANISTVLSDATVIRAYETSLKIAFITSLAGGLFGFFVAYSVTIGRAPRWMRSVVTSFSGLAANFGGVPLAFAFIATLGHTGFISVFLKQICFTSPSGAQTCPFDIYQAGFNLYSLTGLSLAYLYFQFPLMVLTIAPALEGLKREWREASENLGGNLGNIGGMSHCQYYGRLSSAPLSYYLQVLLVHTPRQRPSPAASLIW